ncbi:MAG TPA: DUF2190 domain-containing protein [Gammaproteobacteria bacterium]|nr:DUF2190 domain-containing protein [Gammaproteobacteria bacterium]
MNPLLIKNFTAKGVISRYRIVKHGAADGEALQGAAPTDALLGVIDLPSDVAAASDERVDVVTHGLAPVEYGGAVTRGDPLTSDGQGRAVTAAPAAGSNNRIIGFAAVSGVLGDVGLVDISKGSLQG